MYNIPNGSSATAINSDSNPNALPASMYRTVTLFPLNNILVIDIGVDGRFMMRQVSGNQPTETLFILKETPSISICRGMPTGRKNGLPSFY